MCKQFDADDFVSQKFALEERKVGDKKNDKRQNQHLVKQPFKYYDKKIL